MPSASCAHLQFVVHYKLQVLPHACMLLPGCVLELIVVYVCGCQLICLVGCSLLLLL